MTRYEYKVIPAPAKGRKAPGVKTPEARFAHGLQEVMNELGAKGWEYLRSDLLPSEERQGLTSSQTVYRSVLVFRRPLANQAPAAISVTPDERQEPQVTSPPATDAPRQAEPPEPPQTPEPPESPEPERASDDQNPR